MKAKVVYILARQALIVNTRIFKQAKALTEDGWEVHLIGIRRPECLEYEEQDGYYIHRITPYPIQKRIGMAYSASAPRMGKTSRGLVTGLLKALSKVKWLLNSADYYSQSYKLVTAEISTYKQVVKGKRPTVIHSNDLHTLLVGVLLSWRLRVPLVYDIQELATDSDGFPRWYLRLLKVQEAILIRVPKAITVINPDIGDVIAQRYKRRPDEVILNCFAYANGVDCDGPRSMRVLMNLDDRPIVVFSGNLIFRRGVTNTIKAMALVPEAQLVILGQGREKPYFEELARSLGITIHFHDFIPYQEVPYFIASAACGMALTRHVSQNHYLSSPSKIFAYIQGEVPVLASAFPYLNKLVLGSGIGRTCDPDDVEQIAEGIREILSNQDYYKAKVREAKAVYCLERENEKFMKLYRDLG